MTDSDYKKAMQIMFEYIDSDGDGFLSFAEWFQLPKIVLFAKKRGQVDVCKNDIDTQIEELEYEMANQVFASSDFKE